MSYDENNQSGATFMNMAKTRPILGPANLQLSPMKEIQAQKDK